MAGGAPLARHWAHIILFGAWFGVIIVVLLIDHVRGRWGRIAEADEPAEPVTISGSEAPAAARISMATWPPQWAAAPTRPRRPGARRSRRFHPNRAVRGRWLPLAVIGSLAAAAVHLIVLPEHIAESYWYGAFFAAAATTQAGFAFLLARWPTAPVLRAGAAGNAAVILLWAYTRVVGVPLGPGAGRTENIGTFDLVATAGEALVVVACTAVLLGRRPSRPTRLTEVPAGQSRASAVGEDYRAPVESAVS